MTRGEPFLLLLDSMGGSKDRAVNVIRQYLACEWKVGGWGPEVKIGPEILKFSTFLFRILNPLCPVISSVFLLILLSPFNFKILLYFVPFFCLSSFPFFYYYPLLLTSGYFSRVCLSVYFSHSFFPALFLFSLSQSSLPFPVVSLLFTYLTTLK